MINYGTHATIKLGHKVVEEYFDIVHVEHYNAILGIPFLRKMGIVLDFRSLGMAWIGNEVIVRATSPMHRNTSAGVCR